MIIFLFSLFLFITNGEFCDENSITYKYYNSPSTCTSLNGIIIKEKSSSGLPWFKFDIFPNQIDRLIFKMRNMWLYM